MAVLTEKEIESIRSSADIVDIIKDYIPLTQKGKNYFGVCPFHSDHSPSMSVSKEKQIYKCFSCGAAGNVFTFVANYENVSFIESVKIVANKIGFSIDISDRKTSESENNYLKMLNIAEMFYKNNLNTEAGKNAITYLNERKITKNIIDEFNIGLSLNDRTALYNILNKKGFNNVEIEKAGLIGINGKDVYDLFINRIMFPIHDNSGNVVGFTARIFNGEKTAKYLNSKESEVFKKGKILFNLHRAKEFIKEKHEVIIVEGNMDAIRMYSVGFKNTIALMGTSLTKDQIGLLKKLKSKIVLMLDNDSAGEQATINNGQTLLNDGFDVSVVRLTDYKDPDDYIKYYGYDKMLNAINGKVSFIDFKMFYLKKNKNLNNADELIKYVKEVLASIKGEKDNLAKEITIKKLSEEYNISPDVLKEEINLKNNNDQNISKREVKKNQLSKYDKAVENIINYLLEGREYINIYNDHNLFIDNKKYRNIINEILYYFEKYNNISVAEFISYVEDKKDINNSVLNIIASSNEKISKNDFLENLNAIKVMNANNMIKRLKEEMKTTLDNNKKSSLAQKIIEIKKEVFEDERN